ncbi:actin-like ATPase domain-containing protein [Dendrothele bispora CBS 962.96]|uniref:Actin-like ATPase domain-containing protein n=1 Tax=Dendrothele bispora (strain CBS 962.96) TaxID=1314807 RepID=A0A4S8LJS6_DENBC|nr:actin-like ATPase domain-containing protein [Dendrothele bispora CBS 962.96]
MSLSPPIPIPFPTLPSIPPPPEDYTPHRDKGTPLIIDNGSTYLRWGFATSSAPRSGPNIIAKYKERKNNRPLILFGEAVECEAAVKSQGRTPWEGDVLLNFDALENALDYAFLSLSIDGQNVNHPVLMTERLCSPLHSRALTSELMFEQYRVPSLAYCVDGIMSFYQNNQPPASGTSFTSDGLVISFNTASTSVIPILNGKGILSHAKRLPWGTSQSSDYLLKLIQLKYPNFPTRVTPSQSQWMLHNLCSFVPSPNPSLASLSSLSSLGTSSSSLSLTGTEYFNTYQSLLRSFSQNPSSILDHTAVIQFPFASSLNPLNPNPNGPGSGASPSGQGSLEEDEQAKAERRREQGRKLQEISAKARLEKLKKKEDDLKYLLDLKSQKAQGRFTDKEWVKRIEDEGFDDEKGLEDMVKKLEASLKKGRKKEGDEAEEENQPPSWPLVDIPDDQLDEDQLKEKRKQKLLKAGYEARLRQKKEKEMEKQREKEEKEREEKADEEEREGDFMAWKRKLRGEQEALMTRIKERTRRKAAMSDRKSAAAQARMKSIANLASDERVPKKKRKGGGEDMFGADDADWAIYRKINTRAMSESSDEEDDLEKLAQIEQKLLTHDPEFTMEDTHASLSSQKSAILEAFRPAYPEGDIEGHTRIHLNTERYRVCETWFSPGIAGVDSAGLGEVIQNILSRFNEEEKSKLVKNVLLTGTPSRLPGLTPRLHSTLRPLLPAEMSIHIKRAEDPSLDAWKGMAKFAMTDEFLGVGMTREEYEEYGGERVKRWWGGNWNGGY